MLRVLIYGYILINVDGNKYVCPLVTSQKTLMSVFVYVLKAPNGLPSMGGRYGIFHLKPKCTIFIDKNTINFL